MPAGIEHMLVQLTDRRCVFLASARERSKLADVRTSRLRARRTLTPLSSRCGSLRVNYRLEKEGPFDPGEMILSGSIP